MIRGTFGDDDELFFEIDLIVDGMELPVDAMLDCKVRFLVTNSLDPDSNV